MEYAITALAQRNRSADVPATQVHRTRIRNDARNRRGLRSRGRIGYRWRFGAIAGFAVCLAGCGGQDPSPIASAHAAVVEPASSAAKAVAPMQIIAPPVASAPVAADPAASAPTVASAPVPASTPVVSIAVFGDDASMGIAGYNFGMPVMVKSAAANLQDALQKQFNDVGIKVDDRATGGRAASLMNLLSGMDGGGDPFAQRLTSSQSSIVIISYALNEAYGGETVSDFAGYLGQAIQTARDAGRQPILEEPGPTCDADHPRLAQYAAAIDAAGKQYGVPVIQQYNAILGLPDWRFHMDATCTLPDEALDAFKANQEMAVIAPLVKSLIGSQQ